MKIDELILSEWKKIKEQGDQQAIVDESGISKYKVSLAINYGKADEKTFKAINKYFQKKKSKEQELNNSNVPY